MARKRYYIPNNPEGVIPSRLRRLGRAAQLEYMEAWFRDYYEEPENDAPYSEGENHFVWGGPYDPYDELWNEFGGIVPEDRIQELANKLRLEWVEWAPSALKQQELGAADEALAFPMGHQNRALVAGARIALRPTRRKKQKRTTNSPQNM